MDDGNIFNLAGYETVSVNGFALPCYRKAKGGNSIYVASTFIESDPFSQIKSFEFYASSRIIWSPDPRDVKVDNLWHDVFVWDGEVYFGPRHEILLQIAHLREEISERAPLIAFEAWLDSGEDQEALAAVAKRWLYTQMDSRAAMQVLTEGVFNRIAQLRLRRIWQRAAPAFEFEDNDGYLQAKAPNQLRLELSERSRELLSQHSRFAEIVSELSSLAEAAGIKFEYRDANGQYADIGPTPTRDRRLPRRNADFRTFTEALDYASKGRRGLNFHDPRGNLARPYPYTELRADAIAMANRLIAHGVGKGDRVALIAETGPDFAALFCGAIYAGAWPVPLPMPTSFGGKDNFVDQISMQMQSAEPMILLFPREMAEMCDIAASRQGCESVAWQDFAQLPAPETALPESSPEDICYLQYSSGSTRFPHGVAVTHSALLSNVRALALALELGSDDRAISWLPWYHDMGLVGVFLASIANQVSCDFLRTEDFARRPLAWLDLISRNSGNSISFSPTFGYDICARRISSQSSVADRFDLTRWRIAGNGADMIRPDVMQGFVDAFKDAGFKASSFTPTYGLAEATVVATVMPPGEGILVALVDEELLSGQPRKPQVPIRYRAIVNCGRPVLGMDIVIRGAHGEALADHEIGTVWCKGPSVMDSYFRNPKATAACMVEGWLDTGDMGYMNDGYLSIVGRAKDMIIINGKNHWPQDIEWAIEQLPGFNHGDIAAFSIKEESGEEIPAVLVHCRVSDPAERHQLREIIRDKVRSMIGMNCVVELVPPRTLPRTSSGKLSRAKAKKLYLAGEITPLSIAA